VERWYVAFTRPRHEKGAARWLEGLDVEVYLPLQRKVRRYRSRKKVVDLPLFPRYLFVRTTLEPAHHIQILRTPGVLGLVSFNGTPQPVEDTEIESLKILVSNGSHLILLPELVEGRRVRILEGPLTGAVGVLKQVDRKEFRLVVNVTLLGQSVSVTLDPGQVEVVDL